MSVVWQVGPEVREAVSVLRNCGCQAEKLPCQDQETEPGNTCTGNCLNAILMSVPVKRTYHSALFYTVCTGKAGHRFSNDRRLGHCGTSSSFCSPSFESLPDTARWMDGLPERAALAHLKSFNSNSKLRAQTGSEFNLEFVAIDSFL